jgi:hypothetical protein
MSAGGNLRITAWRGLMASKGLSGAAPVLEGYGLSCEHDLSLLVQEDLNALNADLSLLVQEDLNATLKSNSCPPERLFSMFNATFGEDQRRAFGDYLELAMQSQYNKHNL